MLAHRIGVEYPIPFIPSIPGGPGAPLSPTPGIPCSPFCPFSTGKCTYHNVKDSREFYFLTCFGTTKAERLQYTLSFDHTELIHS